MGIRHVVKTRALAWLAEERRAQGLAVALGSLQRGKQAWDRRQEELLRTLHYAPRGDFQAVGKKLSGLKRRLRELDKKLGRLAGE